MTCVAITGMPKAEDQSSIPPSESPSPRQKIKLIEVMLSFCIRLAMSNHYYKFNGEIRRQSKSGGTGNSLTLELARMFGLWWDNQFVKHVRSPKSCNARVLEIC